MNVWKFASVGNLEKTQTANPPASEGDAIRVRVTKVLVNSADSALFFGKTRTKFPVVPGRYAVGFISEETGHPLYPKGARVLLRSFRHVEPSGTAKRSFDEEETLICGQTCDGFLRDFVLATPDEMTPLPASVSDEQALTVHYVALAKAAIDRLGAQKGQHIAVVGADIFGVILCQLLIYQQAAPILIDGDRDRLAFARGCGVYYTLPSDDDLLAGVAEITGGRLASGAVYVTTAEGNDRTVPFVVSARGSNTVILGSSDDGVPYDLELAIKKQLSVRCVWNCADYVETAINLIANHAVDLSAFRADVLRTGAIRDVLQSYADGSDRDYKEITVITLV